MDKILDKIPYDKMSKFKKSHAIGVGAMLAVAVIIGFYILVYSAYQETYSNLEAKLDKTNEQLKLYQGEVKQKALITKQVATLEGTLVQKKRQLPLVKQLPSLVNKISDVGHFLDVTIMSFKLEDSIEKKFYKEIPITMTIAGEYYRTAGFFDTLQGLLRMVNISKLTMERRSVPVPSIGEYGEIKRDSKKLVVTEIQAKTFAFIEGSEIQE